MYTLFGCKDLGEYHDLYLKTDTFLLCCVGEAFREVCFKTYGLDCFQFFTASNLSESAFLKITKQEIELMTEREHLEITENMIRGGPSSVYAKRFFRANNKNCPDYNSEEPSTYDDRCQ